MKVKATGHNHRKLNAVTKVNPMMKTTVTVNWDKQVSAREVTGTGDDYI